jgi:hypothetical protein
LKGRAVYRWERDESAPSKRNRAALADELDLPPRRARGALKRLVVRLSAANPTLDAVRKGLEEWIQRGE